MSKRSTGLRAYVLGTGSVKAALTGLVIDFYTGSEPATADSALGSDNTRLCRVSVGGNGVNWDADTSSGTLVKSTAEIWEGAVLASGSGTFARVQAIGDDGSASTTAIRLQCSLGLVGADINLSSLLFATGVTKRFNSFAVTVPA